MQGCHGMRYTCEGEAVRIVPVNTSGDSTAPNAKEASKKYWNEFKQFVCGNKAMCGCHAHLYKLLDILVGRKLVFGPKGPKNGHDIRFVSNLRMESKF